MSYNNADPIARLRAFIEVAKRQNFAAAARHLGITTSAISKQVQKLEDHLGVRLLQRTTRTVVVTEAGALYAERAQQLLDDWHEAEQLVQQVSHTPRGVLRVSVPLSFSTAFLAPHLMAFAVQYPELALEVDSSDRYVDLVEEGFDVGIRIGELKDSSLIARKLAPCPLFWYASEEYLQRHGVPNTPEDLAQHRVIAYSNVERSHRSWQYKDGKGKTGEVSLQPAITLNNAEMMCQAASHHLGIALLPFFAVCPMKYPGLQPVLTGFTSTAERHVFVVFPQHRHLSMKVRAFVDAMVALQPQMQERAIRLLHSTQTA